MEVNPASSYCPQIKTLDPQDQFLSNSVGVIGAIALGALAAFGAFILTPVLATGLGIGACLGVTVIVGAASAVASFFIIKKIMLALTEPVHFEKRHPQISSYSSSIKKHIQELSHYPEKEKLSNKLPGLKKEAQTLRDEQKISDEEIQKFNEDIDKMDIISPTIQSMIDAKLNYLRNLDKFLSQPGLDKTVLQKFYDKSLKEISDDMQENKKALNVLFDNLKNDYIHVKANSDYALLLNKTIDLIRDRLDRDFLYQEIHYNRLTKFSQDILNKLFG